MEDLCQRAYEACREHITPETLDDWFQFLEAPPLSSPSNPSTPIGMSPVAASPSIPALELGGPTAVLGPYAQRLRDDILAFVVSTLPQTLQAFTPRSPHPAKPPAAGTESGYDTLLRIYSTLPYHVFKHAVESPSFPVGLGACLFQTLQRLCVHQLTFVFQEASKRDSASPRKPLLLERRPKQVGMQRSPLYLHSAKQRAEVRFTLLER